jgi:glyoxylase-like metal-dependent hydrolase (beta-lactamase superfamily II)
MESAMLWNGATWHDDWYAIEWIDDQTLALAEPRYWQYQVSYLLLGDQRAILFDSGSGKRDIRPVVESFTELPVVVVCSHPHFDHLGNHHRFERVAMFDHPTLRERVKDGWFRPSFGQYLNLARPRFRVTEWWAAGQQFDLGDRTLIVLHVPGHSPDSIALLDRERGQMFLGDYLYNDLLYVDDLGQYLETSETLLAQSRGTERLFGAHGQPAMPYERLEHLNALLHQIENGQTQSTLSMEGFTPQRRVQSGEIDLRMPWFGVRGLLAPFAFLGLGTLLLALVVGRLGGWLASIPMLAAGGLVAFVAQRRL